MAICLKLWKQWNVKLWIWEDNLIQALPLQLPSAYHDLVYKNHR